MIHCNLPPFPVSTFVSIKAPPSVYVCILAHCLAAVRSRTAQEKFLLKIELCYLPQDLLATRTSDMIRIYFSIWPADQSFVFTEQKKKMKCYSPNWLAGCFIAGTSDFRQKLYQV